VSCQRVIDERRVGRDVGSGRDDESCDIMRHHATSCDWERKRVGSRRRKMSFNRRRCGREPRWRERKRKRRTGGSRKRKGFPLHLPSYRRTRRTPKTRVFWVFGGKHHVLCRRTPKTRPTWASFRCSASSVVSSTCQTPKTCPMWHVFGVWYPPFISNTRNTPHKGMFVMPDAFPSPPPCSEHPNTFHRVCMGDQRILAPSTSSPTPKICPTMAYFGCLRRPFPLPVISNTQTHPQGVFWCSARPLPFHFCTSEHVKHKRHTVFCV